MDPPTKHLQICLVEDTPSDAMMIELLLEEGLDGPFGLTRVGRLHDALDLLARQPPQLVLLDLSLPDSTGLETFSRVHEHSPDIPVVILSGMSDAETALAAVGQGAQDYILKGSLDANALARAARFAIERSERLRVVRELTTAEAVQRQLYPSAGPRFPGFDIAGAVFPAEFACGDYFDFIPTPAGELLIALGDVSGHGLSSALIMVETRAYLRSLVRYVSDVGQVISNVNELLVFIPSGKFVSLICMKLSNGSRTVEFASAGHRGFLIRTTGEIVHLNPTAPVIGVLEAISEETGPPVTLTPGDIVLLPTDGIDEAASPTGELFGQQQMTQFIHANRDLSAAALINGLYATVKAHVGDSAQQDDIAMIVVKADG